MPRRRRRGEGQLFFSKAERVWIARVSLGIVDGKRLQRTIRRPRREDAEAELEELRRAYGVGVTPVRQTLDEYLEAWLESNRRIAPSTLKSYREHVRVHISPLLGGINGRERRRLAALLDAQRRPYPKRAGGVNGELVRPPAGRAGFDPLTALQAS